MSAHCSRVKPAVVHTVFEDERGEGNGDSSNSMILPSRPGFGHSEAKDETIMHEQGFPCRRQSWIPFQLNRMRYSDQETHGWR